MTERVHIRQIGHRGDGIGEGEAGPVFVPFTLEGETVTIEREPNQNGQRGRLVSVESESPDRVPPICRHFGTCGGCALQMLSLDGNRALKRRFVVDALIQQAIDVPVDETIGLSPGERRRATLTARKAGADVLLGYHERQSKAIIDIAECPVLVPEIAGRKDALRAIVKKLRPTKQPARLTVLASETGLDVDIAEVRPLEPGPKLHTDLVALCRKSGIARLTIAGELAVKLADPQLTIADVTVRPQPAAFAQAAIAAERAMSDLVCGHLSGCKSVADLFSGFGTFSLALARFAKVHAVEVDADALAALQDAVRHASGLKAVSTERRDILRFALSARELDRFDGAVFDPPRAGAKAQAAEMTGSKLRKVAAISCNPATFSRDSRILIDGGFRLERVVPVDQFVFSAETEIIGLFAR